MSTTYEPEVDPLGPSTLARKWRCDVNTGTAAAPIWVRVRGVSELTPSEEASTQDTTDYDAGGWSSTTNTQLGWGLELTVQRKTAEDGETYDPGQEFLRLRSDKLGPENQVTIRYYEVNGDQGPKVQAYQGTVGVAYAEQGGGTDAISTARITLAGQGRRLSIPHPGAATP